MQKLRLTKAWPAPKTVMQPGEYFIPDDISRTLAKCAVADGAGEIVETLPFRQQKQPAPENKSAAPAAETKLAARRRRGDGAEPDAGSRKARQRKPGNSGQ